MGPRPCPWLAPDLMWDAHQPTGGPAQEGGGAFVERRCVLASRARQGCTPAMVHRSPGSSARNAPKPAGREYAVQCPRRTRAAPVGDRPVVCGRPGVARPPRFGRTQMAKGQKRSGREPKKPKQNKPKATAAASPFAAVHAKPASTSKPEK